MIVNKTKNLVIANRVKICNSFFLRLKGLMFTRKLEDDKALVLVSKKESLISNMIHTLFVFYPIDVVWLDKNFNVVDKRLNIRPFTISIIPKKSAKYIIELKCDKAKDINLNDKLSIDFSDVISK